jgi:hypothetical protein
MSSIPGKILAFFSLLAALTPAIGQESLFKKNYPDAGDTFVEIESIFGSVARQGSLPYRVTIRNNSGKDRVWTIRLNEGNSGRSLTTGATYRIAVEDGSEVQRDVTFSFAPAFLAYDYRNLEIFVNASGLPAENRSHGQQTNQGFPTLAISKPLAQRSLSRLDDLLKKENSYDQSFAKSFEVSYLPVDWTGYSGLDGLLIDLGSWQALSLAQRQAVFAWVRLGGIVDIYLEAETANPDLKLPVTPVDPAAKEISLSLGSIRLRQWDGEELPDQLIAQYRQLAARTATLDDDFNSNSEWPLKRDFGSKEFNPTLVFVLLLVFAILVAPVNLFYFARPGRRHRLFITTPIISVVTCLLVIVVILFTDGVGGKGMRLVLADLQPSRDEMRLYRTQEQISRTGVMINTGFTSETVDDLNPVNLPESNFNPFSSNSRRSTSYDISDGQFSGGFFPSRAEQGFSLRSAEPTRSRIERSSPPGNAGPPRLTSTMPQAITAFYYLDENGAAWLSPAGAITTPGQVIPLEKAITARQPEWLEEDVALFSKGQRNRLRQLSREPNRFFARIAEADSLAMATHTRIKWEKTVVLLTGTPATGSTTPDKATQ